MKQALLGLAFTAAGLLAYERDAHALDCSALPNPVYIQTGDTQEPLMKQLGQKLRNSTVFPLSIVYLTAGSCTNIDAFYNNTPLTVNPKYIPSTAEDPAWTPSMPSPTCTLPVGGVPLDIAVSALFVSACTANPPPADTALFTGPIQSYLFVVPEASTQDYITAEWAYFAFGFGNLSEAPPWNDELFLHIRTTTKSTLLSIAANITVPPAKMKGVAWDKSSEVVNAVATSTDPEKTIGLLGSEVYDNNRATLNALAYRAFDQKYAFFPDSTRDSFDKKNVRDGHYTIFSPTVYIAKVDGTGKPSNPDAKYIIDMVLGLDPSPSPEPDFDPLDIVVSGVKLVPDCAMKVTRAAEGGDLSLYDPAEPCHCYFESKLGTPAASCTVCIDDSTCGAGKCRHGFCEAH